MKRLFYLVIIPLLVTAVGCESMGENTKKGAGMGALAGAALGGVVGHQDKRGWQGALIGGAAGATAGGLIGNSIDKNARSADYLSISEIIDMVKAGTPDSAIIDAINGSKSKYKLNSETISFLKDNGVSDTVIDHMLSTSR